MSSNFFCRTASRSGRVAAIFVWGLLTAAAHLLMVSVLCGQSSYDWDPTEAIEKLDTNQNGKLEPEEVPNSFQQFLKRRGLDVSRTNSVKSVIQAVQKYGDSRRDPGSSPQASGSRNQILKVPGFGDLETPVPGFGAADHQKLLASFSPSVLKQVNDTLQQWDSNQDGMLDEREIARTRWGNPPPTESDSNHDGKLSQIELANRYQSREIYRSQTSDNRSSTRRESGNEPQDRQRSTDSSNSQRDRGDRGNFSSTRNSTSRTSPNDDRNGISREPRNASTSSDDQSKYQKYAESLFSNYDKDKDGKLSQDELKAMRRPPANADQNKDGIVEFQELVDSLSGISSRATGTQTTDVSNSSADDRRNRSTSQRVSGTWSSLDKDANGQIEMHEFSADWDTNKVEQFYAKDLNGDGIITAAEWNSN